MRQFVAEELSNSGIELAFNTDVVSIEQRGGGVLVKYADGSDETVDLVMYATGRKPRVAGLGLEELGVKQSANGAIEVNAAFQSSVPSIYALGDVIDRVQLTPVAITEAMCLTKNLYDGCLLYTSPSPRDLSTTRMPPSA